MFDSTTMPTFDDLANVFWQLGVIQSPAELQGRLVGQLAVGITPPTTEQWLQQTHAFLDPVEGIDQYGATILTQLHRSTCAQIDSQEFSFKILLPDDMVDIRQRVESLGLWCHGFLAGFAIAGKQLQEEQGGQQYSSQTSELLNDMAAISQIGIDGEEADLEQSEQDYFQLSEYLRIATINIYLERTQQQENATSVDSNVLSTGSVKNLFGDKTVH